MFKKLFSVRKILTLGLIISSLFAAYNIFYKIEYWGLSANPKQKTDIWTIEAHVSFTPTGEPIKISLAKPTFSRDFKILDENIVAKKYSVKKDTKNNRIILTAKNLENDQDIYYQLLLFDNQKNKGKTYAPVPKTPKKPLLDEQSEVNIQQLIALSKQMPGDIPQQIIRFVNQETQDAAVIALLPLKKSPQDLLDTIQTALSYQGIPNRRARGIKLAEAKKSFTPDYMLEAYTDGQWKLYDINTGKKGKPENFVLYQRGGISLVDVIGGEDSKIQFSVMKSITSTAKLAGRRAEINHQEAAFNMSVFNLPVIEQNTIKWLTIFPLAILVIVLLRNVVGIQTMGTFTPMLLSMALVKTGFIPGLICFAIIITLGLLIRALMSKFNLLLVPRISAVVIFVILIMQALTILGFRFSIDIALSAVFFPIIIMAWIIERASITWEEDGAKNACREIFNSLLVAIITYFIVSNDYIRHIMYVFNELNLVILFIVMLLGTYTGYRLTELKRFAPILKETQDVERH